jgi:hypothetical protein
MKNPMTITANLHEPVLLRNVVEKLASRHIDMGYTKVAVPQQWKAIESSCIQADVSGSFDLHINGRRQDPVNIPFNGAFLFTCIKENKGFFNLEWCASLS